MRWASRLLQRQRIRNQHPELACLDELRALFEYPALADAFVVKLHQLQG